MASSKGETTKESVACDGDGHGHVEPADEAERGLWGPDGVLAVPHVKMVLFLVFLVQVDSDALVGLVYLKVLGLFSGCIRGEREEASPTIN